MENMITAAGNIRSQEFAHAYYDESFQKVSLKKHHHTQNEMVFVKSGECSFDFSEGSYTVSKNQILLISALDNHSAHVLAAPYKRYVFVSSMDLCSEYINDPVLASAFIRCSQQRGAIDLPPELADELEEHFKVLVLETSKQREKWKERCAGILFDILILLYRNSTELFLIDKNSKDLNVIFAIKEYIDHHYSEPLNLDAVAGKFFINKYYLSHQFKEFMGYGFKKYIQLIRINKAKIMLQNTNLSINEISIRIGYDNINYFIRLFKEKEELTPYQYRKLYFKGSKSSLT
jgi:AraC-like DNA-binding protein